MNTVKAYSVGSQHLPKVTLNEPVHAPLAAAERSTHTRLEPSTSNHIHIDTIHRKATARLGKDCDDADRRGRAARGAKEKEWHYTQVTG